MLNIFKRQEGLIPSDLLSVPITIIGVGGIGSWATLCLAKMGCSRLTVVDPDFVEEHNIPSQFYSLEQRGKSKVDALAENVAFFSNTTIIPVTSLYQNFTDDGQVVICCVDSIEERRSIFDRVFSDKIKSTHGYQTTIRPLLYLDMRMGAETLKATPVFMHDNQQIAEYAIALHRNIPVHEEPCTARSIVYTTFFSGGLIASILKKYLVRETIEPSYLFDWKGVEQQ